jgi:hypothetical protein
MASEPGSAGDLRNEMAVASAVAAKTTEDVSSLVADNLPRAELVGQNNVVLSLSGTGHCHDKFEKGQAPEPRQRRRQQHVNIPILDLTLDSQCAKENSPAEGVYKHDVSAPFSHFGQARARTGGVVGVIRHTVRMFAESAELRMDANEHYSKVSVIRMQSKQACQAHS